jgi:hypothetical protein
MRPAERECGSLWSLVKKIYAALTELELPREMPPRERRTVDLVLKRRGERPRIVEIDEMQHFNHYRAQTLQLYPASIQTAFNRNVWIESSMAKKRLEGGGFGRPRPPPFPHPDGRHRQRAFRDSLADLLPPEHGFLPTLRVAYFELASPQQLDASRMRSILTERGVL